MLYPAIDHIKRLLNEQIDATAALGDVAEMLNGGDDQNDTDIIISLVNIEEVRLARDHQYVVKIGGELLPKNAPVHLDLSLLFVANGSGYENNIRNLQEIIAFFQQQTVFQASDIPQLAVDGIERLTMEMITLGLEQLQQLWSMLGGKYHPSVLYRMRMITIDSVKTNPVAPVKQIQARFKRNH